MKRRASKSREPHLLWVTDPWETLDHPYDTSLRLLEESVRLGISSSWCDVKTIRWDGHRVLLDAYKIREVQPRRTSNSFSFAPVQIVSPTSFTKIIYRTDPPVDLAYLHPLQLLAQGVAGSRQSKIINAPEVLFGGNEKLEASLLPNLMPMTFVASRWEDLLAFGKREKRTVLKPLYQAQSKGVELLDWTSAHSISTARKTLIQATDHFQRPVLLQRYFKRIAEGELRLWFLHGRLLAAAQKCPKLGEFRINMDEGGTLKKVRLLARDHRAAVQIGRHLRNRNIDLAAVDLIEGKITDFNFTSPGLLVEMESLLQKNLAKKIIHELSKN